MVVKNSKPYDFWLSRDRSGSGLYTLWAGKKPRLDVNGYFTADECKEGEECILVVSMHPSKKLFEVNLGMGAMIECEFNELHPGKE